MIGATIRGQSAAELFDPALGRWLPVATPPVSLGLGRFSTTLLPSGEILVLGGLATGPKPPAVSRALPSDPAIYNPGKNKWRLLSGAGSVFRNGHTATVMKDGRVLVAGGTETEKDATSSSAELFDGTRSRPTGSMAQARRLHLAVLLSSGNVLVIGGSPAADPDNPLRQAIPPGPEIYDPATGKWSSGKSKAAYRGSLRKSSSPDFTATPLPDGRVLVIGGVNADDQSLSSSDIYAAGGVTPS